MKLSSSAWLLLWACALIIAPLSGYSETKPKASAGKPELPEFTIVVVESITADRDIYSRVTRAFTEVFEKRKWPVRINDERFGAGGAEISNLELRIFLQPSSVRQDIPGEFAFRAWMVLYENGRKHDFGVVRATYLQRPFEPIADILDKVVLNAGETVADKIEPILFPRADPPKP